MWKKRALAVLAYCACISHTEKGGGDKWSVKLNNNTQPYRPYQDEDRRERAEYKGREKERELTR